MITDPLSRFLYKLLEGATNDPEVRQELVGPEAMKTWVIAFTHESHNPNLGQNYEELEKLGDTVSKTAFIDYLRENYDHINKCHLSEFQNYYMSKPQQAALAVKLGLHTWIKTPLDKNTHIYEDILESFFGALFDIGNKIFGRGVGYTLCYNLTDYIYTKYPIEMSVIVGHAKTQIKEICDKLKWGKVTETWIQNPSGTGGKMTITLPRKALKDFPKLSLTIASVEGTTKKVASEIAYAKGVEILSKYGITPDYARQKGDENREAETATEEYRLAFEKMKKAGYVKMNLKVSRIGQTGCYIQLIGQKPDGYLEVLGTESQMRVDEGKKELLRKYLASTSDETTR